MTPREQMKKFLEVARAGSGFLGFLNQEKKFTQRWFQNFAEVLILIDRFADTHDLWISMAEYPDRTKARTADNAAGICSFWLDVDSHAGSEYANPMEAERAIAKFVTDTKLPQPHFIHRTGYGIQAIWPLDSHLPRDKWQPVAGKLQLLAGAHQLGADPITADAARILRVPGTQNFRNPKAPIRTELIIARDGYNSLRDFEAALNVAVENLPRENLLPKPSKPRPKFEHPATPENVAIVKAMLESIDPDPGPAGTRDGWRNTVWAIAATGYAEAYDIAREWSKHGDFWKEADFNGVWNSFDPDRGVGFGSLVHHARAAGYTGPLPGAAQIPTQPTSPLSRQLMTRRASDIHPEPIVWLVEGSIPLGTLMVIGGQPGLGKSQIALKLAAAITTGSGLPDGQN